MMLVFQVVESPCMWNPYGVANFAPLGTGIVRLGCIDGPCCLIRFTKEKS